MDDLNRTFSDSNETAGDKIDRTKQQTEGQVDEAQSLINEAKEDARRDWASAYSATDEAREELEGAARRKKENLEGSVDESQTDSAAEHLRKRAKASGQHKDDSNNGLVDELQDKAKGLIDRVKGAMDGDKGKAR